MLVFLIRRIFSAAIAVLFVTVVSFVLINISPVDPARVAAFTADVPTITDELVAQMREDMGLNDPIWVRYWNWLVNIVNFDLGYSWTNEDRLVVDELARAMPYTLALSAAGLIFTILVAIPLGILSAVYHGSWAERVLRIIFFAGSSMPNFWLALLLVWLFSISLGWLPSGGVGDVRYYILPGMALSITYAATLSRLLRNNMLENMREPYVLYAKARGLSPMSCTCKHVLKNSMQSTMTAIGFSIVGLLSGTVVIESIFSIPGLGRLSLTAIFNRDFPMIQAYVLIVGVLFVAINLMVDILQMLVDPRLKKGQLDDAATSG